jgi:uncharacterized protein with LGFP repeats
VKTAVDGVATFDGWSDGGGQVRTGFTMPNSDVALAATYRTPIDRRYAAEPTLRAMVGDPVGAEQGTAQLRWRDYTAARLYWTPATGVHEVHGGILEQFLAKGGHEYLGVPINDETTVLDGVGRYNDFTGGPSTGRASIYWSGSTGAHLVYGGIREEWERLGLATGVLGYPLTDELGTPDGVGRFNHFSKGGSIYWHPSSGAHEVHGAIRDNWSSNGWETGPAGYPITNETGTPDGVGRYNHFSRNASIYWTGSTGAHLIYGAIRYKWASLGWETGRAGYPITDELGTPDGVGRYNHFNRDASIYGTGPTGAHLVVGAIRDKWASLGWERGRAGYPVTDEAGTPDGIGAYNHFNRDASIYWTGRTGAHLVVGAIRNRWASLGWERSYLGYPTSDEFAIPGGARSNFQKGYIVWYTNGTVIDRRY